ncbi:SDR family oxidoreductase [Nocardia sp. NPDC058658]|uniref:SDR family oxidoreductase n=1 Tax=Nocardia sp. NPDC058658 TaxID=3346580 RepID=UPI00364684D2
MRDSGLEWTILRPNTFASNTFSWIEPLSAGRPVPNLTGDGRQAVVDPRDVSAVAVAALRSSEHHGTVLGRPPRGYAEWAADHRAVFDAVGVAG